MSDKDNRYMRMAIRQARQGKRNQSVEPLAGAVAVVEGRAVGLGFAGADNHAPAALHALGEVGDRVHEATLFTNIEPCLDSPDLDTSLEQLSRLHPRRVVIGALSESMLGSGEEPIAGANVIERLRHAGIEVDTGVCFAECTELNEVYYKFKRTGLPFVTVKVASTLDGRIATVTGDSQWISGERSLKLAHELRRDHEAVLVGIGTVLRDDPQLTVRLVKGRDPLRVVVDSKLRMPSTVKLLANDSEGNTVIATTGQADSSRVNELRKLGAEVLLLPTPKGASDSREVNNNGAGVDLLALLAELGRRRIGSVLVEGGAEIITSLLAAGQVDRMVIAIAPKIIGKGIEAVGDLRIDRLKDALTFSSLKTQRLGQDVIFDGRLNHHTDA